MRDKADRAKQFAPFAALDGYDHFIEECSDIYEQRRERSEEENENLSKKVTAIKKGMAVRLCVYNDGRYEDVEGYVTRIDMIFRSLTIEKRKIFFDDIYDVETLTFHDF